MKYLDSIPTNSVVIFVVASYGEGEPTDSAVAFYDLLGKKNSFSKNIVDDEKSKPLNQLRYCLFGLGNSSYPVYNGLSKTLDRKLTQLGARRLGERGEGDDSSSMEEDFAFWSDQELWPQLEKALNLKQNSATTDHDDDNTKVLTTYTVTEIQKSMAGRIYRGEQSTQSNNFAYSSSNPYYAPVRIRNLLANDASNKRHCMHLEINLDGTNLNYRTGNHIAMFPMNAEEMVLKTAQMFGITEKLDTIIQVSSTVENVSKKSPFPTPTTYEAALRHYLDISRIPSRQDLKSLKVFAPSACSRSFIDGLANDLTRYKTTVVDAHLTLVDVLNMASSKDSKNFDTVPFALLIDFFGRLQPRFYSISSSNIENPSSASATCVTLQYQPTIKSQRIVYGLNTNYLWSIYEQNEKIKSTLPIHYAVPKEETRLPIYIRQANNFKLPQDMSIPIIMVGPGTGVAPFRGFVRERAFLKQEKNVHVGTTILFFGCRSQQDYLYKEEWPALFDTLGEDSKIITAFSRETTSKVYVQHQIKNHSQEVWNLLSKGAHFYVCGDANKMARDVYRCIVGLAIEYGSMNKHDATDYIANLRKQNRYQEDVWA